jgi:hypothetical protein
LVEVEKDGGRNGADLFSWEGESMDVPSSAGSTDLMVVESKDTYYFLEAD